MRPNVASEVASGAAASRTTAASATRVPQSARPTAYASGSAARKKITDGRRSPSTPPGHLPVTCTTTKCKGAPPLSTNTSRPIALRLRGANSSVVASS
jgi:hypothetical protein